MLTQDQHWNYILKLIGFIWRVRRDPPPCVLAVRPSSPHQYELVTEVKMDLMTAPSADQVIAIINDFYFILLLFDIDRWLFLSGDYFIYITLLHFFYVLVGGVLLMWRRDGTE